MTRRIAVLLVVILAWSGELAAQVSTEPIVTAADKVHTDLEARIHRLLKSKAVVDQAWGAYYAGKYGFTKLTPLLWDLVDGDDNDWRNPQQRCIKSALIQLGATADSKQFDLLLKKSWSVCALNAAIGGKSAEQLMTILRKVKYTDIQIATCNQLVEMKYPAVSKELLSSISIKMEVQVWDSFGGHGRRAVMRCGDGFISVPKGYPPIVDYTLVRSHPRTGDTLLSRGPTNIYLRRREVADKTMGVGSVSSDFDLVQYKLTSLYTLVNPYMTIKDTALRSTTGVRVRWSTVDALATTAKKRVAHLTSEWEALKRSLIKDKHLTKEDSAALPIKVTLSIADHRNDKSVTLPTAKELEAKVLGEK